MQLCDLSAVEIRDHIASKQASAIEVLESCLQRIKKVDGRSGILESGPETKEDVGRVHAFITLTEDAARAQAETVDKMIAEGEDPGPLAGIPATIKDIFCVKDTPSTAGSRILANFISPYTATPVSRMQSAGAVLLGKVNLDEFTYGSSTESSAFQPSTRNPWNTSRVPGGSSGGSAASVAAGEGACFQIWVDRFWIFVRLPGYFGKECKRYRADAARDSRIGSERCDRREPSGS